MRQGADSFDSPPRPPREETDPYRVLRVLKTATKEDIQQAYYALAKIYHPDKTGDVDDPDFKALSGAYALLSDPDKKAQYDRGEIDGKGMKAPRGYARSSEHSSEEAHIVDALGLEILGTTRLEQLLAIAERVRTMQLLRVNLIGLSNAMSERFIELSYPLVHATNTLDALVSLRKMFNAVLPNRHYIQVFGILISERFLELAVPIIRDAKSADELEELKQKFHQTLPNRHHIFVFSKMLESRLSEFKK